MHPTDATLHILREIRDELRLTRVDVAWRIDALGDRVDVTNARLDEANTRLGRLESGHAEWAARVPAELDHLTTAVREVRDELHAGGPLRARLDDHEHRLGVLEKRPPSTTP